MKSWILVLGSLLAPLGSGTARADQVGIVVTGEATLQPQLAAQLERWLHDRGRTIVPGPLEPSAINTLIDCFVLEDLGCARGVVDKRSKAKSVVFARIEVVPVDDGTREIAVTAYMFQKDHDVNAERRVCSKCNDDSLEATVDGLMLALVHEPPPPRADGAQPAAAAPPPAPPAVDEGPSRLVPSTLIGVGAVALIAGGIMIAIDQDPDPSRTTAPTYRDTATGGLVLGIAGAAALGTGIYLWLRGSPSSAPVASVGNGGGIVGWAGRF